MMCWQSLGMVRWQGWKTVISNEYVLKFENVGE